MTTHRRSDREVGSPTGGPTLTGTDDEVMLQALRNLWPILSPHSRLRATNTANYINSLQGESKRAADTGHQR